ncbi:SPOR domain-containing protein [Virgibacillus sediminis]|uniref:SPOR domain-containing protein n=1 Tax=Virgibacillus sediminis TaxID=202260 RepID=A0ABV7A892_9BACI
MRNPAWIERIARGHVEGVVKAFNQQASKKSIKRGIRVIAGSFHNQEYARVLAGTFQKAGLNMSEQKVTIQGKTWYRVQTPIFPDRKTAEAYLERTRNMGIRDAFITIN